MKSPESSSNKEVAKVLPPINAPSSKNTSSYPGHFFWGDSTSWQGSSNKIVHTLMENSHCLELFLTSKK